jgi:restriction endonuclease-like protein
MDAAPRGSIRGINAKGIGTSSGLYAARLRRELALRNRRWARGRPHVESYGTDPVIVYAPEDGTEGAGTVGRHGNFFDSAYAAILQRPEWMRRLKKAHTGRRSLPRVERPWCELDSSTSSDALLMNVFCAPDVIASPRLRGVLGVEEGADTVFGWKARVPVRNGRTDTTEVDLRWGSLLMEAKLTETDFQTRAASVVEGYRDFEEVFAPELLPRVALREQRRRSPCEFAEAYTQEWEPTEGSADPDAAAVAREYQATLVEQAWTATPATPAYASYQLIRNVLAAHAHQGSFCVIHDQRRPDLREAWFRVMAAVKHTDLQGRLKVLTWQELASYLPGALQEFLDLKYGIVEPGKNASRFEDDEL